MKLPWLCVLLLMIVVPAGVSAWQDEPQSRFDELAVQGEYRGELAVNGDTVRVAAQVIALGEDQFRIVVFPDRLPGEDDKPVAGREEGSSRIENGQLVFHREDKRFVFEDGVLKAGEGDGPFVGELKKVRRQSPTLGLEPPEGATVLFDGSDADHFEAKNGGDPLADGLLRPGITSKPKFGDCRLHIEFRLPFEPTRSGQARGNSGIYLQGRYEVQMLDSFGLTGEHNECGGIYSVKKPDINMCFPPGSWQTYDIDFVAAKWDGDTKVENARLTVRHNGVLIHDEVEIPKTTTAAPLKEGPEPGYIYLQDHGSPVRYRNLWVVEK